MGVYVVVTVVVPLLIVCVCVAVSVNPYPLTVTIEVADSTVVTVNVLTRVDVIALAVRVDGVLIVDVMVNVCAATVDVAVPRYETQSLLPTEEDELARTARRQLSAWKMSALARSPMIPVIRCRGLPLCRREAGKRLPALSRSQQMLTGRRSS